MAVRARHDVHESEGDIVFKDFVRRHLAAQDFGEDVGLFVNWIGHFHSLAKSGATLHALRNPANPLYASLFGESCRKKRTISRDASGPCVSVYEPAGLPPDHAWPAPCTRHCSKTLLPSWVLCIVRL